jgi:hypothetical protein
MRKWLLGSLVLLVLGAAIYFRLHRRAQLLETDYAANRQVSIWSTTAPVRELVSTVNYGDRLDVFARSGEWAEVRAASGATGWVSQADLLSEESWRQAQTLVSATESLPPVARGQTRVLSNLHEGPAEMKREDWWLVRAKVSNHSDVSGWILGRFVDLDVPAPLPDYANAAGMRIVAWVELNSVPNGFGATKPQYLLLGTKGVEGQPCDFTTMRAYTWSKKQQQYETAFAEGDLCGRLPVQVKRDEESSGRLTFFFSDSSSGAPNTRTYTMRDTIIRLLHQVDGTSKSLHQH